MLQLLDRLTHTRGSKHILFKNLPAFASFEKPPIPSGKMLTEPRLRVGRTRTAYFCFQVNGIHFPKNNALPLAITPSKAVTIIV
jgi:hypothetical protein